MEVKRLLENPSAHTLYMREYRVQHPELVDYQKRYMATWYPKNKDRVMANGQRYQDRLRDWIDQQKVERGCMDCGYNLHPWVLEFDHRPGEQKVMAVSRMRNKSNHDAIVAEIAKCDVVCANCHRDRTHERRKSVG